MPSTEDPFCVAATLSIDLMKEHTGLDEKKAADIAWQTLKNAESTGPYVTFPGEEYLERVVRIIAEIRKGYMKRANLRTGILPKALEQ